jgi:hypothetical protein
MRKRSEGLIRNVVVEEEEEISDLEPTTQNLAGIKYLGLS